MGRKRKGPVDSQNSGGSSITAPKQKKAAEPTQTQSIEQGDRNEPDEPTEKQAACKTKARKRGRPPKPKTDFPPKEGGEVGRPRNQEEGGNPKAPKLRLVPLKIKDSGRRKHKQ